MATVADELTRLKIRANRREGQRRITIVDHSDGEKRTCTVLDGVTLLATWTNAGKGGHVVHIVDHEEERERRLANPKKSVRVVLNCRTPEQYKEFQLAKEMYFEIAVDPHMAVDLMVKALSAFSRETITAWVRDGHGEEPADVPDWLR